MRDVVRMLPHLDSNQEPFGLLFRNGSVVSLWENYEISIFYFLQFLGVSPGGEMA
jgi:hypothetical protein